MIRSARGDSLEAARILAAYKRLVLLGRLRLPLAQARRLVGPDCAYHLYFRSEPLPRRSRVRRGGRRGEAGRRGPRSR